MLYNQGFAVVNFDLKIIVMLIGGRYIKPAKKHDLDVNQMAIAFVNSQPFVTSTLIGATNMTQLKTNIDAIDLHLSDEIKTEIETIRRDYPAPF
jgi:aryl-alcohol dehydrogenase-like predicted oxidoreductase